MLQPNGARVSIKLLSAEDTSFTRHKSGLIVPSKQTLSDDKFVKGVIIAVGEGRLTDEGIRIPTPFKVGMVVWYNKFNAAEVIDDKGELVSIVDEYNVLGILIPEDVNDSNSERIDLTTVLRNS